MQYSAVSPRIWIAAVTGSAIEWFDYFLYGTLASLVFNRLFFPAADPLVSLSLTYLSFALTFFVRPLGGVFFSSIGDRLGRKNTLVMTLALMGGATVLIGLLPTYNQIGMAAPVLLIALRLVQGLGIGGEWGGALLLAYEYAPAGRRNFFASLPQTGASLGVLFSNLCISGVSRLPDADFLSWGWRLPFLASATLVVIGLWIRKGIDETPDFKAMKAAHAQVRSPLRQTLTQDWRAVLTAIGVKIVETAPFYIFTVFVVKLYDGCAWSRPRGCLECGDRGGRPVRDDNPIGRIAVRPPGRPPDFPAGLRRHGPVRRAILPVVVPEDLVGGIGRHPD